MTAVLLKSALPAYPWIRTFVSKFGLKVPGGGLGSFALRRMGSLLLSAPLQQFSRAIAMYFSMVKPDFRVAADGMTPLTDFMKIRPAAFEFNYTDVRGQTFRLVFRCCTYSA